MTEQSRPPPLYRHDVHINCNGAYVLILIYTFDDTQFAFERLRQLFNYTGTFCTGVVSYSGNYFPAYKISFNETTYDVEYIEPNDNPANTYDYTASSISDVVRKM